MEPLPDDRLWRLAAAGDPRALGVVFERHASAIHSYLFRRTADWPLAEDLTSVVFLEAWRRRAQVELHGDSALPWLYGVATNVLHSQRRSLRRYRAALARLPVEVAERDFSRDADERLDDERRLRVLLATIRRLPQAQRDAFVLCAWCELSYAEAAVALGIPIGTVRSRVARARDRLRPALKIATEVRHDH